MRNKSALLIFVVVMAVGVSNVHAQWVPCGPQGGAVTSLTVAGSDLFAGTTGNSTMNSQGNGVFISSDSGVSWHTSNAGLTDTNVVALGAVGNFLFAATNSAGVFRSSNLGMTWESIPAMNGALVNTFTTIGTTLFAAVANEGVSKSTDDGNTWSVVNHSLSELNIGSFAVIGTTLFASAAYDDTGGVYRSSDLGASWVEVRNSVFDIAAVANDLFAAMYHTFDSGSVMVSKDSGNTWSVSEGYGCGVINQLATAGNTIFSFQVQNGIFSSDDSGGDWMYNSVADFNAVASLGPDLFIGNGNGVYRSTDSGTTWLLEDSGMYMFSTPSPARSQLTTIGNVLIGVGSSGLVRSTDDGDHWIPATQSSLDDRAITSFTQVGSFIYAVANWGVYRSSDSGISWMPMDSIRTNAWSATSITAIGTDLFAGIQNYDAGVWRSTDSGMSWESASSGLEFNVPGNGVSSNVNALASKDGILFAASDYGGGLFESTDLGVHWSSIAPNIESACFAFNDSFLYAATGLSVGRSSDNALDWSVTPIPGLDSGLGAVNSLQVIGSRLFAGSRDGIFLSVDSDQTWLPESHGLQGTGYLDSDAISFTTDGQFLFASTGNSVWRRPLSDFPLSNAPADVISSEALAQTCNYPNPFSQSTTISFNAPISTVAEVTVVNLLGSEVTELYSGELSSGYHSITWNAIGMSPGMYECLIRANGKVQIVPMLLEH
jgi:hypothetical protein